MGGRHTYASGKMDTPKTDDFTRMMLSYSSNSKEDCMKHFLEDKYWDGKSFYEVAPDMEWIDLQRPVPMTPIGKKPDH